MNAFHSRIAASVVLLALTAASSLRAGPGVDYWMRKHVFPAQAKATAAAANQSVSSENTKKVEVTRIEHAYRGVPHQVVVQVPAEAVATSTASAEKAVESSTVSRSAGSSSSSAVIH